jgi:hypothetical protein
VARKKNQGKERRKERKNLEEPTNFPKVESELEALYSGTNAVNYLPYPVCCIP